MVFHNINFYSTTLISDERYQHISMPSDDGLYFPLFGAGELYRRLVSLLFGQSHLPPFPFDAAA